VATAVDTPAPRLRSERSGASRKPFADRHFQDQVTAVPIAVARPSSVLREGGSWEFIAADRPLAARKVRKEILEAIRNLVAFPDQDIVGPI
jgi:hypothetical protein